MRKVLFGTICGVAGLILAQPSAAQTNNRFSFNIGAGFTEPVRAFGRLDPGFNFNAGAGVNLAPAFGVVAEFGYNQLGLSRRALNLAGVPGGGARIYSVTLNPIIHMNPHGRFDAYIVGGGGFYRRTIEFTEPTLTTITLFDPFYGVFYPAAVPANTVLGSFTQNKGGWNAGAGLEIRLREDGQARLFAESRYHHIYTSPRVTKILPVTFGFRW